MRVSFPNFSNIHVVIKAVARKLGVSEGELVVPPPTTQKTLDLGVKYSPVEACLPFKLTLGNLIEACEMGADTLIQARGTGICRLGYYAKVQEQILSDLGYNARFLTYDVSRNKLVGMFSLMRNLKGANWFRDIPALHFGMSKLFSLDRIDKAVRHTRAVEGERGVANQIYKEAIASIDGAENGREVKRLTRKYVGRLNSVARDPRARPVRIGVTGEIYVVLEPFANMDLEMEMGKLGVQVERTLSLSRWVKYSLFLNPLGIDEWKDVRKAAMPYLKRDVGGDGWESVGEKVFHSREYDGLVHVAPFTCMPEIVAENIMPSTKEDLPVLSLVFDEQMGKQGMITRLEAFVDLLKFRRRSREKHENFSGC